jgi:hypothetical protein
MSKIGTQIAEDLINAFPIATYVGYILAVILLGVFARVGYKVAKMGGI